MDKLQRLAKVDFRHNNLKQLPSTSNKWNNIQYLYLANNPLCDDNEVSFPPNLEDAIGLCKQQCTADCPSFWLHNGWCDDSDYAFYYMKSYKPDIKPKHNSGCNVADCQYDTGDCKT